MAQTRRRQTSNTAAASLSRRSRKLGVEDEGHEEPYAVQRKGDMNSTEETDGHNAQEEELSTQAISELETDITTFIRNTGRNDGWPSAFQKHVGERGEELQEKLRIGVTKSEQAEESFQAAFLPFLAGCLARVGVRPIEPQRPFPIDDPSPEDQPLFVKSSALIQASRNLLDEYSDLAALRVDTSSRDRLLDTLAREEVAIDGAIRAGRQVAQAEIAALLGLAHDQPVENAQRGSAVLRLGAQEVQARAREKGGFVNAGKTERWAVVAAETVKAFGKISKVAGQDRMVD